MKMIPIAGTDLTASNIVLGCMRIKGMSLQDTETLIRTSMEEGVNFFDHADIYGGGECETHFSKAIGMNANLREKMIIQSKCGIRGGYFDFSKEHILASVDGILGRLNTDYLDILLLHRPDALVEPEEVAEAFDSLQASGKVRHFGVSNHSPLQIELLKKFVKQPIVANQLQFSIAHTPLVDSGIALNMNIDQSVNRDGGILDYSRLHDITVQAWSPFQQGFFKGPFLGDLENYKELNEYIDTLAAKYDVTNTAIAVAWITRHPANIQVVLGTTNVGRLKDSCKGSDIPLTRQEWYGIYKAAGNMVP
ncbi:aldo/keto reductase [Paenibacillus sp. MY03]|jgi:predicted oxidoreductase|uniref:Aldo/keto reductase n=1 Tax=Paenibacillus agaridevorans TaxID=171404 RepID=A0A2R5F064_9BACL|nr:MULTISPECIES: aldo/keto reductase [Paenibacillus]OUS73691.1 aldo/keto reductase [Paenibacillus sp. MY03]GBG12366.1 aldo/keto reductase [Paenibacillus agaridevorans]